MRPVTVFVLPSILLFSASSAGAFAINMTSNYEGVSRLEVSDTMELHVSVDSGKYVRAPHSQGGRS